MMSLAAVIFLATCTADVLSSVNPFIGTDGDGHVTPAACVPFGMVQAGPDTGVGKWSYCSGYQYSDDVIIGFSQTHLSGTGCPDLGDVSIMPFAGEYDGYCWSKFKKESERASPGFYAVRLEKCGIDVSVTTTKNTAFYAFTYSTGQTARILVNLPFAIEYPGGWSCRWHSSRSAVVGDDMIAGEYEREVWCRRKVGFAVQFSRPFSVVREIPAAEGNRPSRWLLDFASSDGGPIMVKVALSRVSADAARANLMAESPGWDFAACRHAAELMWRNVLSRFEVEGSEDARTKFMSALYRLCIQPNDISDSGETPFYSTFSTWDTYRAAHPLYTLLVPELVPGMVESLLAHGRHVGYMPIWSLWGDENQCMIGTHSVPVIVDCFLKECSIYKEHKEQRQYWLNAYAQIKDALTKRHPRREKEDWRILDKYGYYPFDLITGESVSRTLECAYDDWCAGMMAEKLALSNDAEFFFGRAGNWRNVFDASTGFMRGKDSAGSWREPFDQFALGHGAGSGNDFTEGNSWQYTWHVQHDPTGLISAFGGTNRFLERLDALFRQRVDIVSLAAQRNVAGVIGQYAHGNEPSHHIAYFYTLAGRPDRTAEVVRQICDRLYRNTPGGLCGNEDCGQMSAWYIFSAMGFYPFNPCGGEYIIGAPQVPRIALRLPDGKRFSIVAKNLSERNMYVKSVTLNGKPLADWKIHHKDITCGGELVFEMTSSDK